MHCEGRGFAPRRAPLGEQVPVGPAGILGAASLWAGCFPRGTNTYIDPDGDSGDSADTLHSAATTAKYYDSQTAGPRTTIHVSAGPGVAFAGAGVALTL